MNFTKKIKNRTDSQIEQVLTNDYISRHIVQYQSKRLGLDTTPLIGDHQPEQTPWKMVAKECRQDLIEINTLQRLFDYNSLRDKTITSPSYGEQLIFIGVKSCIDMRSTLKMLIRNVERVISNGDDLDHRVRELNEANKQLRSEKQSLERQLLECNEELHYKPSNNTYVITRIDSSEPVFMFNEWTMKATLAMEKGLREKYFKPNTGVKNQLIRNIEKRLIDKYFKPAKQSNVASTLIAGDEEHFQSFSMNTIMFADIIFQFLSRGSDTAVVLKDRTGEFRRGAHVSKADVKRVVAEVL